MSSLVERLRVRTDRRPIYSLFDDSDDEVDKKSEPRQENFEKIFRPDAKDESCQACGGDGDLLYCESCTYAYHPKCLLPPLKAPLPSSWRCPECVSPLNDIDKILDCEMRPTVADDSDASKMGSKQVFVKQYLVKWKGLSYLHCIWVPEKEFLKAYKLHPRLKTKVNNFHRQMSSMTNSEEDYVAIRSEWTTVDRILACRGEGEEKEYLVKWKELPYDECYWEFESDISSFQQEIERYHRVQCKQKSVPKETTESKLKPREFQQYERSPEFLSGGSLHPYQLEGLNFLRFAWSKQTHVILADEMGLGKTIQSIAFLASLFEEDISPHLVVAPLSTLRNWEREFATWAPQMNVVMYVGSAQARAVIREYEFFFPKNSNKIKKKKSGQAVCESKKDRTKFDVLLTSYEMINMDSASLKPIKWECMIVDEGHRLKNKDSKLFSSLKQYSSRHRVLLTGTPLQNNLDELFMLMHFLDAGKFGSLEEFQQEFEDISQEEQISRLHKMLAPHLLRRVKKDVMKELPPKKELILRVELSSKQKEYYKAILTRNFQILARKGGAQISLINVVMELRKLCCHPFMLEGVEPEDTNEFTKQLLESSGKLQLLDKMMVKLKEQGHRVLIYSQFQHMLDLLEDYCTYKKWHYERIDGKVPGAERQIRIDRFNAKNSSRFCFLLSTRAGGLGINLATADTVIIYDSDWNPHADLQAMARAHRLGQTNKVMIFRLILRGTIEERMMQMTKKKMVLEHLVVGRLKAQNINQEELDDIIRYGSKELFADENDEAGKLRQIHYDDAAIDRLLNREQVVDEVASMDDEEEDSFLKAFKVANFEYIEEAEATPEEDIPTPPLDSERATYWEELLRDRYEMHKVEEFNGMGKGKRSRKQMVSVEDDDLAGLEEVTSDGEDDNYEADLSDGEAALPGAPVVRRPYRKRSRVDSSVPLPLMEGEGKSFRVLGFNQSQRAAFVKILMRFGVGDYDWAEFTPRLKQKTYEEIKDYGFLFLSHIAEDITESPTFTDGVPKEGLRIPDVLLRIAVLVLIRDKVKAFSEERNSPLFAKDIVSWFPGLKGGRVWKEDHDLLLLRAVLNHYPTFPYLPSKSTMNEQMPETLFPAPIGKLLNDKRLMRSLLYNWNLRHGYGRWQAIIDDKELRIQEVVCKELNLPSISLPMPGASQPQVPPASGASQVLPASGVSQAQVSVPGIYQAPNGVNTVNAGTAGNQVKAADETKHEVTHDASDPSNRTQLQQDSSLLYHLREMQRRQVEFIRKRVMLLENAINAEYQREVVGYGKPHELPGKEMECDTKIVDEPSRSVEAAGSEMVDNFPKPIAISPRGISEVACDGEVDRLSVAQLYNKMCEVLSDLGEDSFNGVASQPASLALKRNLLPLEAFFQEMKQVLSSTHQSPGNVPRRELQEDWKPEGGKASPVPSFLSDGRLHSAEEKHDNFPTGTKSFSAGTSNLTAPSTTESNMPHNISPSEIPGGEIKHCSLNGDTDIEMVEKQDSTSNVVMDTTE